MLLSIVIPNRNDTVMLGITVRSALEELKSLGNDGEIVIVDNSDEDIWQILKTVNVSPIDLAYVEEGRVKLIRQPFPSLYSARQTAIEQASGKYVYNVDSHMLIGHNSLKDLVDFMESYETYKKVGMAFAPICWLNKHESWARHDIRIDNGIFGIWGRQYKEPTKICWNFGSCIVNREWFLKVHGGYDFFAKQRLSWGGGEFYAALKTWLLGYENWAVPCSPQYHIGPWAPIIEKRTGIKYRVYGKTGTGRLGIGVFAAFYALGGDEMKEEALRAEKDGLGYVYLGLNVEEHWEEAKRIASEAYEDLQKRQVISYKQLMVKKPWQEGWNDWKPDEEIKRVFDLSMIT
jgi:glycosyltransferase involved in cell wall biosynthesis